MSGSPSDLSDGPWQKIAKFFERPEARGAREKHSRRRGGVEAGFYRLREGCRWRALPHDFPPWSTLASHFRLRRRARRLARGRARCWARAGASKRRDVAGAPRAPRSWTVKASKAPPKEKRAASMAASASRVARARSRWTARAHSWPRTPPPPPPTKPLAPRPPPPSWSRRSSVTRRWKVLPLTRATGVRPKRPPERCAGVTGTSPPRTLKRRLLARRFPLARRADLCLAGPGSPALQGARKNRCLGRSVALVRGDASARATTFLLTTQVLRQFCRFVTKFLPDFVFNFSELYFQNWIINAGVVHFDRPPEERAQRHHVTVCCGF